LAEPAALRRLATRVAVSAWLGALAVPASAAPSSIPAESLAGFSFAQHPGAGLPLGEALRDESGRPVRLGNFFSGRPVILAFEYFRCPGLCGLVLDHLATSLTQIPLMPGRDFEVIAIGIDPADTPADAAMLKARHLARGTFADGGGFHFLTGEARDVSAVADAVGFRYAWDGAIEQFAHPAGIVIAAPNGTVSRYLLGVDYAPLDLRLGIVEAAQGTIAAPASRLLLLCYGYDPARGRYSLAAERLIEAVAAASVAAIALLILAAARRPGRAPSRSGRP